MTSSIPLPTLADVVLMSIYKPILFVLVVSGWAWVAGWLDKDLEHYFLPRRSWNAVQMSVAVVAFGLWLLIVYFWVGLIVALVLLISAFFGYAVYRNAQVPEPARWTFTLESLRRRIEQAQVAQATKRATVSLMSRDGSQIEVPAPSDPSAPAYEAFQNLMDFVLPRGGDRIDLTVDANQCAMVVHIDGVKFPHNQADANLGVALIEYLKHHGGLDVADRRRRQYGQLLVDAEDYGRHTLDLAFSGSTRGMSMVVYVDRQMRTLLTFDQLGLLDPQKQLLQPVLDLASGVVIVACPQYMGLTTTIYSLVNTHDPYTQSIVTLEDQVAFELEGVNHEMIKPGTDTTALSSRLAVILRGDPQVVMMSSLPDSKIARQVCDSSETVRFYVGLRQQDTFSALRTWVKAVGDRKSGGRALSAIISQRLVRKLCPVCRVGYRPDPEALRKLNLPPDRVSRLFKHTGQVMVREKPQPCTNCHALGYRDRVGVFEVMVLDDEGRDLIGNGDLDKLRSHLRRNKMLWLQEAALYKAVEGVTSISEITRALGKESR